MRKLSARSRQWEVTTEQHYQLHREQRLQRALEIVTPELEPIEKIRIKKEHNEQTNRTVRTSLKRKTG